MKVAKSMPANACLPQGMFARLKLAASMLQEVPPIPPDGAIVIWRGSSGLMHSNLLGDSTVFGRAKSCDVPLDAQTVSRRHFRIDTVANGHVIADLGSSNGTFANGIRIGERELCSGDLIEAGSLALVYVHG